MGFWTKVIGGAVIGVGAVAAAPFTGGGSILGAVSLAASLSGAGAIAAGAGVVGAAAGAALGRKEEEENEIQLKRAEVKGQNKEKAEYERKLDKLRDELAMILRDIEIRENFLVTALAVGICAANADHEICADEQAEIEELVLGLSRTQVLSQVASKRLVDFYTNPPGLMTVWQLIEKNGFNTQRHIEIFDNIIEMVVWADGEKNFHESEFMEAWNSLVA